MAVPELMMRTVPPLSTTATLLLEELHVMVFCVALDGETVAESRRKLPTCAMALLWEMLTLLTCTAVGLGVGVGVGLGVGLGVGFGVGFAVGLGVGVALGVGEGVAVGATVGDGV